jgi:hypothetical protein
MMHFLLSIDGAAPEGGTVDADARVLLQRVVTPNDGFARTVFADEKPIHTTFSQLENALCELS